MTTSTNRPLHATCQVLCLDAVNTEVNVDLQGLRLQEKVNWKAGHCKYTILLELLTELPQKCLTSGQASKAS